MVPAELYELESITDNPRFCDFAYRDPQSPSLMGYESRDDDLNPGFAESRTNPNWIQPSLRSGWIPIEVIGNVPTQQDFACLSCVPVFSQRACDLLHDLLEPSGELLPLQSAAKQSYFVYNIRRIADVLDAANSDCSFFSGAILRASNIRHFSFFSERLDGLSIFRIREKPVMTIVSDDFVRRVVDADLQGFSFTKIWPVERGTNWRHPKQRIRIETTGTSGNEP